MNFTRRAFLMSSLAAAATPSFAALPAREADVIVIGAGAAGIAAARRIAAANRKVVIVEAAPRPGGRCVTDTSTFSTPFDLGAHALFDPQTNPLTRFARPLGFDIYAAPHGLKMRIGRRFARPGEMEDYLSTIVRITNALGEAARGKADVSCAGALPANLGEWGPTAEFVLGPWATGKDLKDISAVDFARAARRTTFSFSRQGLGALLARLAEGLPIALAAPVNRIVWTSRNVQVETSAGRIDGKAAIVTASTNVIAAGKLKFSPDLPGRHLDAMRKLALGHRERIALLLSGNPLGLQNDDVVVEKSAGANTGALIGNVGGSSLCVVEVAGAFGRDLSARGDAAMTAFATDWLAQMFGGDVAKTVTKSSVTRWGAEPYVLGSSSVAAPGAQPMRKQIMEPVGPVYFAGEAAHETLWGTIGGAWESGERAAEASLKRIGALKEEPTPAPAKRRRP
jgi:monoamine oxidase